jgi:hypothetical protein
MDAGNTRRGPGAFLLSLSCCVGVAAQAQNPPTEIIGQFLPGKLDHQGRPGVPTLRAKKTTYEITFSQPQPTREELDRLAFKMVAAKGTRATRRDASGKEHPTLRVAERPRIVGNVNYLVGYRDQPDARAVEELCKKLELTVLDHYRPGKYFRVEPTSRTPPDFPDQLEHNQAVRYVEPNIQYRIPPGESPPKPSRGE